MAPSSQLAALLLLNVVVGESASTYKQKHYTSTDCTGTATDGATMEVEAHANGCTCFKITQTVQGASMTVNMCQKQSFCLAGNVTVGTYTDKTCNVLASGTTPTEGSCKDAGKNKCEKDGSGSKNMDKAIKEIWKCCKTAQASGAVDMRVTSTLGMAVVVAAAFFG